MDVSRDSVMETSNLVHIRHLYRLCEWSSTQFNCARHQCSGFNYIERQTCRPLRHSLEFGIRSIGKQR
jgi:hypothetical protein